MPRWGSSWVTIRVRAPWSAVLLHVSCFGTRRRSPVPASLLLLSFRASSLVGRRLVSSPGSPGPPLPLPPLPAPVLRGGASSPSPPAAAFAQRRSYLRLLRCLCARPPLGALSPGGGLSTHPLAACRCALTSVPVRTLGQGPFSIHRAYSARGSARVSPLAPSVRRLARCCLAGLGARSPPGGLRLLSIGSPPSCWPARCLGRLALPSVGGLACGRWPPAAPFCRVLDMWRQAWP